MSTRDRFDSPKGKSTGQVLQTLFRLEFKNMFPEFDEWKNNLSKEKK